MIYGNCLQFFKMMLYNFSKCLILHYHQYWVRVFIFFNTLVAFVLCHFYTSEWILMVVLIYTSLESMMMNSFFITLYIKIYVYVYTYIHTYIFIFEVFILASVHILWLNHLRCLSCLISLYILVCKYFLTFSRMSIFSCLCALL